MIEHAELPANALYRIVAFTVPEGARAAFLERAAIAEGVLLQQPGLLHQRLLARESGPGRFSHVSIAAWADQAAMEAAQKAIAAMEDSTGFDRPAFLAREGIVAETAVFSLAQPLLPAAAA